MTSSSHGCAREDAARLLMEEEVLKMQIGAAAGSPASQAGQGRQACHRTKLLLGTARQQRATNLIQSAPGQGRQKNNRGMEEPCRSGGEAAEKMQ